MSYADQVRWFFAGLGSLAGLMYFAMRYAGDDK